MSHRLRVNIEPAVVREVDDAELVDLARQGLLHSYEHTDEAKAVLEAAHVTVEVARWKGATDEAEVVTPPAAMTDTAATADTKKKGA